MMSQVGLFGGNINERFYACHFLVSFNRSSFHSRHSTMIVGQTGSGKSIVWKTLQSTLSQLKKDGEPGFNSVKVTLYHLYTYVIAVKVLFALLIKMNQCNMFMDVCICDLFLS